MHGAADEFGSHKVIMNPVQSDPRKLPDQDYFVPYHMPRALSSQE